MKRSVLKQLIKEEIEKVNLANLNKNLRNLESSATITPIQTKDIPEILNLNFKIFGDEIPMSEAGLKKYLQYQTDWNISKKAEKDGKIIECYLFNNDSVYKRERKTHPSFLRGWDVSDKDSELTL